jgi:uncharacterized membrane protein YoaK (UPF0700 family)
VTDMTSRQATALSVGLGFVAGYVDTVGFVALFGLFTAHVTGNFVLIGSALAHSSGSVLLKLLVFPAFIVSVAVTRLIVLWLERRTHPPLRPLLILQSALLAGFMVTGWLALPLANAESRLAITAGLLGASAMGVQNAASRLVLGSLAPTTVMTGNVTQLVIDLVDLTRGAGDSGTHVRVKKFVGPIIAFSVGAMGGGMGYVYLGFAALALPILVLSALAFADAAWEFA